MLYPTIRICDFAQAFSFSQTDFDAKVKVEFILCWNVVLFMTKDSIVIMSLG